VARGRSTRPDESLDIYLISSAAELLQMHPQTLRKYERLGLVTPLRTLGSMRVYRRDELERLRLIKSFVDEAGINLAGVQRLLSIAEVVQRLRPLLAEIRKPAARQDTTIHDRLADEMDELLRILGLERRDPRSGER
jgi:MerR family transcriptional regulator/heat shock protein HspR